MLIFIAALIPYNHSSYFQIIPILIGVVSIVGLISIVTEKQREHWKALFGKIFCRPNDNLWS
jgi:hypothetical protein